MQAEPVLELNNVTKLYKNGRGVEALSFTLQPGEVLGLLGPNGSGKTTTMKVIAGLLAPTSGQVTVCGFDTAAAHEQAMHNMGCIIEIPALYDYLTVGQNMRIAAKFYPQIPPERIQEVLEMVEMDKYQQDKTRNLSLGMRQRVGLALALYNRPKLLVLDEPSNGLDIEGIRYVREVIKNAAAEGTAVLVSSHLAAELQECAAKVAVIRNGKLIAAETMENALKTHSSLEEFFLAANRLQGVTG